MIESIEGKRGMPRLRPPYVAQVGSSAAPRSSTTWKRSTGCARSGEVRALVRGRAGMDARGCARSRCRRVAKPGSISRGRHHGARADRRILRGMLDVTSSMAIFQAARRAGSCRRRSATSRDFDTLQPHGSFIGSAAVIVLSQRDRARATPRPTLMRFFADESCGQCTPCRVGTEKAVGCSRATAGTCRSLTAVPGDGGRVDLRAGTSCANPISCVIRYFPQELKIRSPQ